ncbi:MAG: heme-binding domain-containing protein [Cyclobacteriaceae bacterium]|nr:heme-binding domain-containing protein [Cyclobacteriaceae bacterium]
MKKKKFIFWVILLVIVIIQFVPLDRTVPEYDKSGDFIAITAPSMEIQQTLKRACYDCHSFETKYPWYAYVAPVSFWVGHHIDEGREHLNFSVWSSYDAKKSDHKLEELAEEVEERKMPMTSYVIAHSEAKLSAEETERLVRWVEGLRKGD